MFKDSFHIVLVITYDSEKRPALEQNDLTYVLNTLHVATQRGKVLHEN